VADFWDRTLDRIELFGVNPKPKIREIKTGTAQMSLLHARHAESLIE